MDPNRDHVGDTSVRGDGLRGEVAKWLTGPPKRPGLRKRDVIFLAAGTYTVGSAYREGYVSDWAVAAFVYGAIIALAAEHQPDELVRRRAVLRVLGVLLAIVAFALGVFVR